MHSKDRNRNPEKLKGIFLHQVSRSGSRSQCQTRTRTRYRQGKTSLRKHRALCFPFRSSALSNPQDPNTHPQNKMPSSSRQNRKACLLLTYDAAILSLRPPVPTARPTHVFMQPRSGNLTSSPTRTSTNTDGPPWKSEGPRQAGPKDGLQ